MRRNVAYLRVSTEAQTEKYGLDMQKQKIMEYCSRNGITIAKWYVDGGYSGSKLERPEIQNLLDDAERDLISKVLIYKLDRMSRDVIDTLNLLYRILPKYGVEVVSMTEDLKVENPMDKVVVGINAIVGQYERETIYMRTRAGMRERVKKGLWMGGGRVPYGYYYDRNDGILHPKEEEAERVREAYKLYIDGYSCDKIAKMLGFDWERIVSQILKRKSNIGLIEYKGEVYQGKHEPIVDEKTFYEAQECMERRKAKGYIRNINMLTGLCVCGVCRARMRYQKWGKYHKLVCYSQQKSRPYMIVDENCSNEKAFASKVEHEVESVFRQFAINVEESQESESNREILEKEIKKKNVKIKRLYGLYAENESENLIEVIRDEEKKLKEMKDQLSKEIASDSKSKSKIDKITAICDVWDNLTDAEKNKILKECIEKVVITNGILDIHFVSF